ncbi:MAG: hypothetical protein ACJ8FY_06720 [Gemmataceae bacterium]
MISTTQHEQRAEEDYANLKEVGILAARDGIRWHRVDQLDSWDFSSFLPMLEAANRQEIQVIWTLCHYGWPEGLDLLSAAFVKRFAQYCEAVARSVSDVNSEIPFYSPINEIAFLTYSIDKGYMHPYVRGRSAEVKRQLVRAALAGCEALWRVDPRARIVHVDPLIHVVPPRGRPDLAEAAAAQDASQFEVWDMLAGRRHPELGGGPEFLDIIGVNYYHANQWELPENRLCWEDTPRDDRWVPLHRLLAKLYERYKRPLFLGETSHFGVGRAPWLREIVQEVVAGRNQGVPIDGICLYPIIDRHDWEDLHHWHNSGLWDVIQDDQGGLQRVLNAEYAAELQKAQQMVSSSTNA